MMASPLSVMLVASLFAIFAFRALLDAPMHAGAVFYHSVSTALAASFTMLLLAGSGLPSRDAFFRRLLKAAAWAACSALVFIHSAGGAALSGDAQDWFPGSIAFAAVLAAVFVAGEIWGEV